MVPAASCRRNRGCSLAAALALAAAYQLVEGPLAYLSAACRGAQPRAQRSLLPGFPGSIGRSSLASLAARGGEQDVATLEVGDKVRALSPDDEQWYPGRLQSANDDGTWVVAWDDPDGGPETVNLGADNIKKVFIFKEYKAGDDCMAVSPDDERWYPGVVAEVLGEGKFRVKWDDPDGGDETADFDAEQMRRQRVKRNYKPGDEVLAKYPDDGNMYEAKVVSKNEDGTFKVKWDDPDGGPAESDVCPKVMKNQPIPFDQLKVGDKYTGTVCNIREFGAFVDVGAEREGLLHISRISNDRVENVEDYLEEGQEIECWISGVNAEEGRFGITMVEGKLDRVRGAPADMTPFVGLDPNEWREGEVANCAPFGLFVRVTLEGGEQAEGLVHITQIRDGFVENTADEASVGDKVKVRVLSADPDTNRMSLTMKEEGSFGGAREPREPADLSAFESIDPSTWLTGTVARIASFGAFVDVKAPDSDAVATGMVHVTQIKDDFVESIEDELSPGQEVQVRVVNVDAGAGRMGLSMKQPEEF